HRSTDPRAVGHRRSAAGGWRPVALAWGPRIPRSLGRADRGDQDGGSPRVSDVAIRLTNVRKSFGATPIILGVSLDIRRGERHALEIGITIANGADTILLDEPTAGMSRSEANHAVALIRRVTEGKTLVMVEHDMSVVFDIAEVVTVLVYGQVIASDVPAAIRANRAVQGACLGTG